MVKVAAASPSALWLLLWLVVGAVGCSDAFDPPPDIETGTGGDAVVEDVVVFDGEGHGKIHPPMLRDRGGWGSEAPGGRWSIVVGAPAADVAGVTDAGELSVLFDPGDGQFPPHRLPQSRPSVIAEGQNQCGVGQAFAWELREDRALGSALAYFGRGTGDIYSVYDNEIIASVPDAANGSGRVLLYPRCYSCAIFPRPEGHDTILGTRFGASVAVGFFSDPDEPLEESLIVGAPAAGDGLVAVLDDATFRAWDEIGGSAGMHEGVRECQCTLTNGGNSDCLPWTETLHGSYPEEEFGAALAVADFDCDGIEDVAVGAPGARLPGPNGVTYSQAGAAYVFFSTPYLGAGYTVITQGAPEVGGERENHDRFGGVLIAGNFNGDRLLSAGHSCYDLVVGTPNEDESIGEIQLFSGSPDGLLFTGPTLRLDDLIDREPTPGDQFGYAMTAGDFDKDGYDDLAIGAPGAALGGLVVIVPGRADGLAIERASVWTHDQANATGARAGHALSWTWGRVELRTGPGNAPFLVVGAPGEGGVGAVFTVRISLSKVLGVWAPGGGDTWFREEIGGGASVGDQFGAVLMPARAMVRQPWDSDL